jgi:hypothetical protein
MSFFGGNYVLLHREMGQETPALPFSSFDHDARR